jgi:hypothetical protein
LPYAPAAAEVLRFSTRPNNDSYAYDWAYWIRIDVK